MQQCCNKVCYVQALCTSCWACINVSSEIWLFFYWPKFARYTNVVQLLNLILWMMTSISLVSSGISYSERAWSRWCSSVIPLHFLNTAQGLRGESPHFPFCASWQSVCGWCAAQHPIKVSKQDFRSPSGIFITLFQLGSFYWLQRN